MKKLIAIFAIAAVLVVMAGQVDDDLSDTALNIIDRVDDEASSESYLYLNGIFAGEDDDPIEVGRNILEKVQYYKSEGGGDYAGYPDSRKIDLPQGDEFCGIKEEGCFEYLFTSEINHKKILKDHALLVERSERFLGFNEFVTLSKPTLDEALPPYRYVIVAERIKVIEAISHYRDGRSEEAMGLLSAEFARFRSSMALQDNLIGRLVFLAVLSEMIDVMSVIGSDIGVNLNRIPELSKQEKNLGKASARELAMLGHVFEELDRNPEFFQMGGNLPGWLVRIVYKPNMTLNAVAPFYDDLDRLVMLDPSDFAMRIESSETAPYPKREIRNYYGSVMAAFSMPNVYDYAARVQDLDAKIRLFNQVHHLGLRADQLKNPYYENETPKYSDGSFCFSGPVESRSSLRCLRVTL